MSSQRGNIKKSGPPKHQNKTAFKNNMHDKTKKIEMLNRLEIVGCCARCKDIIDWKIKYKKYKPLTQPKTCTKCHQKTIKRAYYIMCEPCSETLQVCAKCGDKRQRDIEDIPSLSTESQDASSVDPDLLPDNQADKILMVHFANDDQSGTGESSFDSFCNPGEENMTELEQELAAMSQEALLPEITAVTAVEEIMINESMQKTGQLDIKEKENETP